jgi:hypothetical protein
VISEDWARHSVIPLTDGTVGLLLSAEEARALGEALIEAADESEGGAP